MATHRERMAACLAGQILDRPPVALWRHQPVDDQSPETLAAATLHFQQTFDFDLVKVTPASSFCLRDWGVEDAWTGNPEGTRRYIRRVISKPQDWARLPELDPHSGHLARQIECLRLLRRALGAEVPLLQTIFNPLAQAKNLAGEAQMLAHLRRYPEAVLQGLEIIATSTRRFIEAAIETGIDGIFYAVQHAQAGLLTAEEYQTFGLSIDRRVLTPTPQLWCNILHLHGRDIYFEMVSAYASLFSAPLIVNWHDRETPPTLSEAQSLFGGVVCGGLSRDTLVLGTPAQVREEAQDAIAQTGGKRLLLSTGCVVPIIAPFGNLVAASKGGV
ncbi:MAG: uroporphyrinogen decarboxylase family protein [Candidatus Villigracilaceae bacterium]